jgi:hypothetical protein
MQQVLSLLCYNAFILNIASPESRSNIYLPYSFYLIRSIILPLQDRTRDSNQLNNEYKVLHQQPLHQMYGNL